MINKNELDLPQGYSAFLSFEQKEEHDDFVPVDVLEVYQAFEASQNPVISQDIITEIHLMCGTSIKCKGTGPK